MNYIIYRKKHFNKLVVGTMPQIEMHKGNELILSDELSNKWE